MTSCWRAACTHGRVRISIPASSVRATAAPEPGAARTAKQNSDPGESLQPSWDSAMRSARASASDSGAKSGSDPNPKSGTAKQDSSDSEPSANPTPKPASGKSANNGNNNSTNNSNNSVPRADNSDLVTEKASLA